MTLGILVVSVMLLTGFSSMINTDVNVRINRFANRNNIEKNLHAWSAIIRDASHKYQVDEKLIKSIIYIESGGNPYAKSKSNAIGLMQIKPSSAGLEVYRLHHKKGQPSIRELYNPKKNIDIGVAYINFLEKKLINIKNKDVMRYATILAYVNGTSALLKIFSKNSKRAIDIINTMSINTFYLSIKKNIQQNKLFLI